MNALFYLGAGLFSLGVSLVWREHAALRSHEITEGSVVALVKSTARKSGGAVKPQVRFSTRNGVEVYFSTKWFVSHPGVRVGDQVRVAYPPTDPWRAKLLRFGWRYGFAFVVCALGLCLLFLSFGFRYGEVLLQNLYPLSS